MNILELIHDTFVQSTCSFSRMKIYTFVFAIDYSYFLDIKGIPSHKLPESRLFMFKNIYSMHLNIVMISMFLKMLANCSVRSDFNLYDKSTGLVTQYNHMFCSPLPQAPVADF